MEGLQTDLRAAQNYINATDEEWDIILEYSYELFYESDKFTEASKEFEERSKYHMEVSREHLDRKITAPKFASPSSGKQGISHAKSVSTRATTEDDWSGKHAQLRST